MNTDAGLPNAPPGGLGWDIPAPNPVPETPSVDPVNVPMPGADVIFPGSGEPLGIPPTPGPDIPVAPPQPEII